MNPTSLPLTPERIRDQLAESLGALGYQLPASALRDDLSITDLGVDSFHLTDLARLLEQAYGRHLDLAGWVLSETAAAGGGFTLGSLIRHILARSQPAG